MAKMRAMVLSQLGPIEESPLKLTEMKRHEISRPNEILLRIEACGVCHSQLHGIEGDWQDLGIPPQLPIVPGHEIVGRVVETGSKVTRFKVGDRAGVSPLLESCGACMYCVEGRENLCDSMDVLGESLKGGYSEYVTVHEDFATEVPDSMSSDYAAPLFCAGITAYKAVKACDPAGGQTVGIFGIGGVGHMAVQFARIEGCRAVAISRSKKHLDVAAQLGAAESVEYGADQGSFLNELWGRVGLLDAAIVFAPADAITDTAIKAVKKGGIIVIATVGRIPHFLAFEEKTVRGTLIGTRRDMEEVVRLAAEHNMQVVSESFPLERANEVLAKLKRSEIDARAVLIP